jgi:hypothetical protein
MTLENIKRTTVKHLPYDPVQMPVKNNVKFQWLLCFINFAFSQNLHFICLVLAAKNSQILLFIDLFSQFLSQRNAVKFYGNVGM